MDRTDSSRRCRLALSILQVLMLVVQTHIFFPTLVVAAVLGFRQIAVSRKQADIGKTLANLQFAVSPEITYEAAAKRVHIYNKGHTNIYVWGSRLGDGPKLIESNPRLITRGGFYYLSADNIDRDLREAIGRNAAATIVLQLFLAGADGVKYTASTEFLGNLTGDQLSVHAQTISILPKEWD